MGFAVTLNDAPDTLPPHRFSTLRITPCHSTPAPELLPKAFNARPTAPCSAPVPTYKTADESVVGSVGANVLTFATDEGVTVPGTTALFKVYTVTKTGRERGSRAVTITRQSN